MNAEALGATRVSDFTDVAAAIGSVFLGVTVAFIIADRATHILRFKKSSKLRLVAWMVAAVVGIAEGAVLAGGTAALPWLLAGIFFGGATRLAAQRNNRDISELQPEGGGQNDL